MGVRDIKESLLRAPAALAAPPRRSVADRIAGTAPAVWVLPRKIRMRAGMAQNFDSDSPVFWEAGDPEGASPKENTFAVSM
jgi:hypothetical protein